MTLLARSRNKAGTALLWAAALLLLFAVLRTVSLADTWAAIRQLSLQQVLLLIGLNLLIMILLNARWWFILRGHGRALPFLPLLGYRLATFGVSYFTPGPHLGGEPLQVYLVEKEQQVPRATAVAAMTLDKTLELSVNFLFLLVGVALILQQRLLPGGAGAGLLALLGFLLVLPLAYLAAVLRGRKPLAGFVTWINDLPLWQRREAWHGRAVAAAAVLDESEQAMRRTVRHGTLNLALAFAATLAGWLLMIGEFWLMAAFLGAPLTLLQLVLALTAARLAILLFLPGGLGVLEASQVLAFSLAGLNPALGISVGLLIRARDVALGAAGLWWGGRKLAGIKERALRAPASNAP